jgi:hypothetical protein
MIVVLGLDFDECAVRNQRPDFFDLCISDSNAAVRPILQSVTGPDKSITIWKAVNHDVTTRRAVSSGRSATIVGIRVRHVQRAVKPTLRISSIDLVYALGSAVIALAGFRRDGNSAKGDFVSPEDLPPVQQSEAAVFFEDQYAICRLLSR